MVERKTCAAYAPYGTHLLSGAQRRQLIAIHVDQQKRDRPALYDCVPNLTPAQNPNRRQLQKHSVIAINESRKKIRRHNKKYQIEIKNIEE